MAIVLQIIINILIAAAVYSLVTLGFSLVYSVSRVLHLAHSVIVAAAGFIFFLVFERAGISWFVGMITALAAAVFIGFIINWFVYHPLKQKRASGLVLLLATLALLILGSQVLLGIFGPRTFTISPPYENNIFHLAGAVITTTQILLIITSLIVTGLTAAALRWTMFGKKFRAVADNPELSETAGVNAAGVEMAAIIISSLTGGIAGILLALEFSLQANMTIMLAVKLFTVGIIGGVGSLVGTAIGSLVVAGAENITSWFFGSGWQHAASFLLLFLFLLFRPRGIFGQKDL